MDMRVDRVATMDARSATWAQTPELRIADYKPFQALDGEGLRCSLYVSYCPFNCTGCYNKAAQKRDYGAPYTAELEERILRDVGRRHVAGLTLVGGEPMLSARHLLDLVRQVRALGKTVWCYTGYTWETLNQLDDERRELLELLDVLIDGQFIAELRDEANPPLFAGSSNQRLIDVPASLEAGEVVKWVRTQS